MSSSITLREASRFWLQLGLVSFGGPAGQISLLHRELVERRRWISEQRYLHALNYCMLLPGPEAMQLATYLGWLMHGVPGGLIAGGLFVLPSVFVLTGLSSVYALWGQLPLLVSVFAVLKPAVLAVVVMAAFRIGSRTLRTPLLRALALSGFLGLTLFNIPYPLLVIGAGVIGLLVARWRPGLLVAHSRPERTATTSPDHAQARALHDDDSSSPDHARFSAWRLVVTLGAWALATLVPLLALVSLGGWNGILALMARFFTRVALLSFGGAYAVLPYVAQGAVEQFNWLSPSQMLDGLALGETTPGPLIMVVAFVGFMGGWNQGLAAGGDPGAMAIAATLVTVWFTFLPSFGFILAGAPLVEASRGDLRFGAPLSAITAVVVGLIASLAVFFAAPVLWPDGRFAPWTPVVAGAALFAQLRLRWSVLRVIGTSALAGAGWAVLDSLLH
jgi:chromate transporter